MAKASEVMPWLGLAAIAYVGLKAVGLLEGAGADSGDTTDAPPPLNEDGTAQVPTLSAMQLLAMATAIEWAVHGVSEDEDEVIRQLTKCMNDADVYALAQAYGVRRPSALPSSPLDLASTVTQYLSASDIAEVNDDYSYKGINFRF